MVADADTPFLSGFYFNLSINTPYGSGSLLNFVEPRPGYEADSDYVFKGATLAGPSGDTGLSSPDPGPHWFASDAADDPSLPTYVGAPYSLGFVPLTAGTSYLLARLNLTHTSMPSPYDPSGQQFTVTLEDLDTAFFDETFDTEIPFTSTPGTVTIQGGVGVVPEPSSLLIFAGLALCAAPCLRRRRRRTT